MILSILLTFLGLSGMTVEIARGRVRFRIVNNPDGRDGVIVSTDMSNHPSRAWKRMRLNKSVKDLTPATVTPLGFRRRG